MATEAARTSEVFHTGQVMTIVGGHFTHDTFSAFLAPLLPLIIQKLSLSLTLAGALPAFVQLPGLLNPFIGYLADRVSLRYFVILAPAVSATIFGALGLAPSYAMLAIMLFVAGISVAAFHAPAPAMVARIAGHRVGRGMSLFMAGGELGRTVGPLLAAWAVSLWTLEGMFRVVIFGWIASVVLYLRLRDIPARSAERPSIRSLLPQFRRVFLPLLLFVALRVAVLGGLPTFLPTYMVERGADLGVAAAALTLYELAGVGGALLGGTLSDLLGRKPVIMAGTAVAALLLVIFVHADGFWLVILLLAMGFAGLSTAPVLLAIVQEHFTENRAVANGVFLSISFATRPIGQILVGNMGDRFDLGTGFIVAALLSLLAVPVILLVPDVNRPDSKGL
ncbi:MAG: MFS transporter [Anaerolineales bacterium]